MPNFAASAFPFVPIVLFGDPMSTKRTYLDLGGFTYLVDKNIELLKGLIEEAR